MSLLECVKLFSTVDVVETTTDLVPMMNVTIHAVKVSKLILSKVLYFCTAVNICEFYPESGICEAYIPSYFYNVTSKRCDKFIYGGCGGNANRFSSLDQCQATCSQ